MSSSTLRRLKVLGLTLSLGLLPLAGVQAAPLGDGGARHPPGSRIHQLERSLFQSIEHFLVVIGLRNGFLPPPGSTDGSGIDPHGGNLSHS